MIYQIILFLLVIAMFVVNHSSIQKEPSMTIIVAAMAVIAVMWQIKLKNKEDNH